MTPAAPDPTRLDSLIDLLILVADRSPGAVGLRLVDQTAELHLRPLPGADPTAALLGWRAPPDWDAFAMIAPAEVHDLGADQAVGQASMVHLVTRSGRSVTRLATEKGIISADEHCPAAGWIPDLCRRVLTLPTAAPATSSVELLTVVWLDRILTDIIATDLGHPRPDWSRCVDLLDGHPVSDQALMEMGAGFARRWPWTAIRRRALDHPMFGLAPAVSRWLDDGSFARFVLGGFPPIDELLADVTELVDIDAAERLTHLTREWLLVDR